ncbi:MAG: 2-oxo acid dehydrogenase subunit E2 [Candidatus Hydrogenedentales bacterium]
MSVYELRIPQLGEGLREARIVRLFKNPGEPVHRDEPVYEMETDKAVSEIESPVSGILEAWCVRADDIVGVGDVVARVKVSEDEHAAQVKSSATREATDSAETSSKPVSKPVPQRNAIPPRTRAYAREKGLEEAELAGIAHAGSRLMPSDIDRYIEERAPANAISHAAPEYEDVPMSTRQRTLFYRLSRAQQQVVPGTIEVIIPWQPVEETYQRLKQNPELHEEERPTRFMLVAWCVAQTVAKHPKFRSVVVDVNNLRRYRHANLGIAVALPDDELATAVVERADALHFPAFVREGRKQVARARAGKDQAVDTVVHIALSSMEAYGVYTAAPVVVPPSVATLFLGTPHMMMVESGPPEPCFARVAHMALTFDHRIINGVAAARFLNEIRDRVASLPGSALE